MTSAVPYAEVIGDPISHSKSPLIHGFWLRKLGIRGEYHRCHVRPAELADYLAGRRTDPDWQGCNITIPHKVAALDMVDDLDRSASEVGATNCIRKRGNRLLAFNTDVAGVAAAVSRDHKSACIIGAGGAARAALPNLADLGARDIRILSRDPDKAAASLNGIFPDLSFFSLENAGKALGGVEGIINASPLGMIGQPAVPVAILDALSAAAAGAYVFDMVYAPLETPLLKRAREMGFTTSDGLTMLIGQAARAFELFFGAAPPRQHDSELRRLLAA